MCRGEAYVDLRLEVIGHDCITFFVEETGEFGERQLNPSGGEAERFQRDLQQRGVRVCPDGAGARLEHNRPKVRFSFKVAA